MRVLQIVSAANPHGTERHVLGLSQQLRERGHQLAVLCREGWLSEELQRLGFPVIADPLSSKRWATHRRTYALLEQFRPTVIHTHLTEAAWIGLLHGFLRSVPVVATVHMSRLDPVFALIPRRGGRVIAVSHHIARRLSHHGLGVEQGVRVIHNSTEFAAIEPPMPDPTVWSEFNVAPQRRLIGLVARVEPDKRHTLMVQAFAQLPVECRRCAHLLMVGTINPRYAEEVRQTAHQLGVASHVTLTGIRTDVARLIAAMDFVVLPSRMEAFAMSVLEGMALGKPVLVTGVGGLPEAVEDGVTGRVVSADPSPAELATVMAQWLLNDDLRRRMGMAARATAVRRFSPATMVTAVEQVYAELM